VCVRVRGHGYSPLVRVSMDAKDDYDVHLLAKHWPDTLGSSLPLMI